MTFFYDLQTTDTSLLLISQLRFQIGDTVESKGVKPDGSNFADDELAVLLEREGNNVEAASADALEILANSWAGVADLTVGPRRESLSRVATQYEKRASSIREKTASGVHGFSIGFKRNDGYEKAYNPRDYE